MDLRLCYGHSSLQEMILAGSFVTCDRSVSPERAMDTNIFSLWGKISSPEKYWVIFAKNRTLSIIFSQEICFYIVFDALKVLVV